MEHLNLEELARLVDEEPSPEEAVHLEACEPCAAELCALRDQTAALGGLGDLVPPAGLRRRVEAELVAEGLIGNPSPWTASGGAPWRIAAGIALFLLGGATGALVTSSAGGRGAAVAVAPSSPAEAADGLRAAELEYLRAVTEYAELTDAGDGLDPLNRLAALEGIVLTTRAALQQAPADPVINNYHLTAMGQRDALLRRIEAAATDDEWF